MCVALAWKRSWWGQGARKTTVARCGATTGESASGSRSGSGSGSGSGISEDSLAGSTDNALVSQTVAEYKTYVLEQIDSSMGIRPDGGDRAGDLEAAKRPTPVA
jgi:hypothetical protein